MFQTNATPSKGGHTLGVCYQKVVQESVYSNILSDEQRCICNKQKSIVSFSLLQLNFSILVEALASELQNTHFFIFQMHVYNIWELPAFT